jgi:hypothetical protein
MKCGYKKRAERRVYPRDHALPLGFSWKPKPEAGISRHAVRAVKALRGGRVQTIAGCC